MRCAIIIPTLTIGGAEKIAVSAANSLSKDGHDVTIIVINDNIHLKLSSDIKLHILRGRIKSLELSRYLNKGNFDFCLSYMERANLISALASILTKTVVCCSVHTAPSSGFQNRKIINRVAICITYFFIKLLKLKVICVSDGVKMDLNKKYGIKNSTVIYNFIDFNYITESAGEFKEMSSANMDKLIISFVGRLNKIKGCDILIDAINLAKNTLHNVHVNIIGDGPEKKSIMRMVHEYNLEEMVSFKGGLKNPYSEINGSDYIVVPSYAEGFGLIILEALALNRRVIYSKCDFGPREIIGKFFQEMLPLGFADPSLDRDLAVKELSEIFIRISEGELIINNSYDSIKNTLNMEFSSENFTKKLLGYVKSK